MTTICPTEQLLEAARVAGREPRDRDRGGGRLLDPAREPAETLPQCFFHLRHPPPRRKDLTPELMARDPWPFSTHARCVAIGGLRLDYFYNHAVRADQHQALANPARFLRGMRKTCGGAHPSTPMTTPSLFLTRHKRLIARWPRQ